MLQRGSHFIHILAVVAVSLVGAGAQAQDFVPGEVIIKLKGKASSASASQFMGKVQGKLSLKNCARASALIVLRSSDSSRSSWTTLLYRTEPFRYRSRFPSKAKVPDESHNGACENSK